MFSIIHQGVSVALSPSFVDKVIIIHSSGSHSYSLRYSFLTGKESPRIFRESLGEIVDGRRSIGKAQRECYEEDCGHEGKW